MTDYTKLIERLYNSHDAETLCADAALVIEALQSECAEHKENAMRNARQAVAFRAERDALQSKLDAMGEPVGYVGAGYLTLGEGRISEHATDVYKVPVYAAPKALAPQPLTDERQPLSKVLAAVREYLPPDGISAKDCLSKIIAVVDPWPLAAKPLIALKDEEISLMAHNEDEGDWNDLRYRDCWHKGYKAGARATEAAHGIGGTP